MSEQALAAALLHLDRAVGRIERVARPGADSHAPIAKAYALLDERHGLLRQRIQETIERLDALIAAEGDG